MHFFSRVWEIVTQKIKTERRYNSMWEIAICDSDPLFAEELAKEIRAFYHGRNFEVRIKIYLEGAKLLDEMDTGKDVVFLNTRLSDARGFGIAAFLRMNHAVDHPLIVFLSDHSEDMQAAFEYCPVDFINKSVWKKELERALDRLWIREHHARSIQLGTKKKNIVARVSDIVYIESEGHYLTAHMMGDKYRFRGNLRDYARLLDEQYFAQPSKSHLVNCAFVERVEDRVIMKNDSKIPFTKARKPQMEKMMKRYAHEMLRML